MKRNLLNLVGTLLVAGSVVSDAEEITSSFHLYLGGEGINSSLMFRCEKSPCRLHSLYVYAGCIHPCLTKNIIANEISRDSLSSLTSRSVCRKSTLELHTNEHPTPIYSNSSPINYLQLTHLLSSSDCHESSVQPCHIATSGVQILCRGMEEDLTASQGFNLTYGPTFKLSEQFIESEKSIRRGDIINITCPDVDVIPSSTRLGYMWSVFHTQKGSLNITQQLRRRLLWSTWEVPSGHLTFICTVYDEDEPPRSDAFSYHIEASPLASVSQSAVYMRISVISILVFISIVPVMLLVLSFSTRQKLNKMVMEWLIVCCCRQQREYVDEQMTTSGYPSISRHRYKIMEGKAFQKIRSSVLQSADIDLHFEPLMKEVKKQKIKPYMSGPDGIWLTTSIQKCEDWIHDYPSDISTSSQSEGLVEPELLSIYCDTFKGMRLQITTPVSTPKKDDWIALHRLGNQEKPMNRRHFSGSELSFSKKKVVHTELTIGDISRMANSIFSMYKKLGADVKGLCHKRNIEHIFCQFNDSPKYEEKYRPKVDAILNEIFHHVPDTSTYAGIQYELMKKIKKLAECNSRSKGHRFHRSRLSRH